MEWGLWRDMCDVVEEREGEKLYPNAGVWVSVVFLIQPRAYLE